MSKEKDQSEYWDSLGVSKAFSHPLDMELFGSLVTTEQRVLDFGCGYGRLCDELYRHGYPHVTGMDRSAQMINRGKNKFPHLDLQVGSDTKSKYDNDYFDAVLLFAVLTCIPSNEDQQNLIDEIYRILKPGGIIYVSDYYLQSDERNRGRYRKYLEEFKVYGVFQTSDSAIVRHHEEEWMGILLSRFERIKQFNIDVLTMNGNDSRAFQYIGRK